MSVFFGFVDTWMSPRSWRKVLGRLLPEGIKKHFRKKIFGFGTSTLGRQILITETSEAIEVSIGGATLYLDKGCLDSVYYHCRDNADSVEEIISFGKVALGRGGLLVDVGAADGLFSLLHCQAAAGNRSIAFEPGDLFEKLVNNTALNQLSDRLLCRREAVGEKQGVIAGVVNPVGMFIAQTEGQSSQTVEMVSLDELLDRGERPSMLKIDVEGYERQVLIGASRIIAACKPVIFLELHLDILESKGIRASDVLLDLANLGYEFTTPSGSKQSIKQITGSPMAIFRLVAWPA